MFWCSILVSRYGPINYSAFIFNYAENDSYSLFKSYSSKLSLDYIFPPLFSMVQPSTLSWKYSGHIFAQETVRLMASMIMTSFVLSLCQHITVSIYICNTIIFIFKAYISSGVHVAVSDRNVYSTIDVGLYMRNWDQAFSPYQVHFKILLNIRALTSFNSYLTFSNYPWNCMSNIGHVYSCHGVFIFFLFAYILRICIVAYLQQFLFHVHQVV